MIEEITMRWAQCEAELIEHDGASVRHIYHMVQETLPALCDWQDAEEAMQCIYRIASIDFEGSDLNALTFDDELSLDQIKNIPIYQRYEAVYAYAYFGLPVRSDSKTAIRLAPLPWPIGVTQIDRQSDIQNIDLEAGDYFDLLLNETKWMDPEFKQIWQIAKARIAVDNADEYPSSSVSIAGLSGLAGISLKSLQNDLMPSSASGLVSAGEGSVTAKSARSWLSKRRKYIPSIWHLNFEPDEIDEIEKKEGLIDVIFIPVSSEGESYEPSLMRGDGKFYVGPSGNEHSFDTYLKAVEALTHMSVPTWRKPDKMNRWRTKTGIRWERMTPKDLGLEFRSAPN